MAVTTSSTGIMIGTLVVQLFAVAKANVLRVMQNASKFRSALPNGLSVRAAQLCRRFNLTMHGNSASGALG